MEWDGAVALPAGVPDSLDLPADPQLVHDLAQSLNADLGSERAKIAGFVPAAGFHSVEDEAGRIAQRRHVC